MYTPEWDFYLDYAADKARSVFLDMRLQEIAPLPGLEQLLCLVIKMKQPRTDGLSSSGEFDALSALDDSIISGMKGSDSCYAGRETRDGHRSYFFYTKNAEAESHKLNELIKGHFDYSFRITIQQDPEWSIYLDYLFPAPANIQEMMNQKTVAALEEGGDMLTKPRPVEHWIYFRSEEDRAAYSTAVVNLGYEVVSNETIADNDDWPYQLVISRTDRVDLETVNEYVLELWDLAQEFNGDYDGWETSIETS